MDDTSGVLSSPDSASWPSRRVFLAPLRPLGDPGLALGCWFHRHRVADPKSHDGPAAIHAELSLALSAAIDAVLKSDLDPCLSSTLGAERITSNGRVMELAHQLLITGSSAPPAAPFSRRFS